MSHAHRAVQVGGAWLAVASLLMIATLVLHGPIPPELGDRMTMIAESGLRWSVAHWMAAAGLSLYAVSGLIVLTSGSRLTTGWWTLPAWGVVCVGCLWTMTTAVAETTVLPAAAVSGSSETFAAWWMFAEAKANGFAIVALAIAVIAGHDARSPQGVTPTWSACLAVIAGIAAFAGWAAGMWFGIAGGSPVWVASSIAMSLWTLAFGIALVRAPSAAAADDDGVPAPALAGSFAG